MNVSVIIPAYNMARYVGQTLQSLLEQTFRQWEAIVIDDGSSDETAAVVAAFAQQDSRIRLLQQDNQGASAARNAGIARARGDWFLFLDADDWLLPQHLERMVGKLQTDPTLDAVHCGWARVSPSGDVGQDTYAPDVSDMFELFAQYCAFQPHACLVRSSLVRTVGGFEVSLPSCQDWDLWQRVARTGARFGAVRESLARYRTRPGSISLDGFRLIKDGLHVITQGHSADTRVPNPAHPFGRETKHLAGARLLFTAWSAGLVLGDGHDAQPLLHELQDARDPHLSPSRVAAYLFEAALLSQGRSQEEWARLWPQIEGNVIAFVEELERLSGVPDLAQQTLRELEDAIADVLDERPLKIGRTYKVVIDITSALQAQLQFADVERLHCHLQLNENQLGKIKLPVIDGLMDNASLVDAIAGAYAWPILGHFFENTIYPQLRLKEEADGYSLWRGDLCLAHDIPDEKTLSWSDLHDDIGWTLFLQELWGKPAWPTAAFYNPHYEPASSHPVYSQSTKLHIEVSGSVPDVKTPLHSLIIIATVGGAELGEVTLPASGQVTTAQLPRNVENPASLNSILHTVSAQEIRAAITAMGDFELCRLAVRQALIGRPLNDPATLRQRLQQAAANSA